MMTPAYLAHAPIQRGPQTLELETYGTFTVEEVKDESGRCGVLGSSRTLGYRVVIETSPHWLDERGFVIDWQDIDAYFKTTFRALDVFPSCERIACRACDDLVRMLGGRCHALDVIIGGAERPAGMTAKYRRPDTRTLDYSHEFGASL